MEPFNINLNQMAETSGRYKRFLLVLAVVLVVIAIITFILLSHKNGPIEWIFLSFGVNALMFIYFAYVGYRSKIYFSGNDFAIEYQFGFLMKKPTTIIWEVIDKVRIGPTYITFFKKSGKGKKIELGWLPYKKLVEIKDQVQQYSKSKSIKIDIAEFSKI